MWIYIPILPVILQRSMSPISQETEARQQADSQQPVQVDERTPEGPREFDPGKYPRNTAGDQAYYLPYCVILFTGLKFRDENGYQDNWMDCWAGECVPT